MLYFFPFRLGVTSDMVEPFLEGMTLNEALNQNKIFMVDMKILDQLQCKDNRIVRRSI